jgi:YegS/Rv2252/BmrU family lipid kinase
MKHIFIINPMAGKKDIHIDLTNQITEYFSKNKDEYEIFVTKYAGNATEIAKKACQENRFCRIYAFGGDGTVNEVVAGAFGYQNAEIGIYPSGTGNDFYKMLSSNKPSLASLIEGEAVFCDLIRCNEKIGINVCSIGFDSEVARHIHIFKKVATGNLAYTLSLAYCFLLKTKFRLNITIDDGEKIKGDYLFTVAANGAYYGGGFYPAPKAKISDGFLDFVLIKAVSKPTIISLIHKYKDGTHLERKDIVTYIKGKKMTVRADKTIYLNIDGEVEPVQSVTFEMIPQAVKMILPKNG